ncbi:conjugative transposon protein TraM [Pedobacter frigoris]|uniref:Conjugative transposon protein TraM n=2 Tax=Pedobacter frigoris TaxID=2571272 RepID=A0A4U1CEC0_9SPHI|nr:conjugative transposon protein TraM [Pedobacter frigoris]
MAFWSLGGGSEPAVTQVADTKGLNLALPDADFKNEKPVDKMSLYDQAQRALMDSADLISRNYIAGESAVLVGDGRSFKPDPSEAAIQAKLAQINAQVNAKPTPAYGTGSASVRPAADPAMSTDIAKLEALMKNMQQSGSGDDPEMRQLNSMMDKILAIQNPDLVRQQNVKPIYVSPDSLFKAIPAEIAGNIKAVEGSVIELRLLDTLIINGQVIPKGHSIFGLANFSNQRINLEIKNIRLGNQIIPVSLTVFDKRDGMVGVNAPEALLTDAVNGGADDAIRNMQLLSMDQGIATQVAGAGLEAAKGLFSKNIKRVKQKLVAGYAVLLRDNSRKNNK